MATKKPAKKSEARSNSPARRNKPAAEPIVVGIGASAGGVDALQELFKYLPPNTGMAFVVLTHLDPRHESTMSQIISRVASMPVNDIRHGEEVQPNHVYVLPPNRAVTIKDRGLQLSLRKKKRWPVPGDRFLPQQPR